MGDHYVPRHYLEGFTEAPNSPFIYRYEKGSEQIIRTNIKNVAQEKNFYTREVEQYLASEIETPGGAVLRKIKERRTLTKADKAVLARYMLVQLKRVPDSQERMRELIPETLESLFGNLDKQLQEARETGDTEGIEILQRHRGQLEKLGSELVINFPWQAWNYQVYPYTTPRLLVALEKMTWLFWVFDKEPSFFTSDNPVFFHEGLGIGNLHSEVSFPISPNIVLWTTWQQGLPEGAYIPTTRELVQEINRRTASAATRYLFHSVKTARLVYLINKKRFRLQRIVP